jgi:uncharacterized membrane protein
VEIVLGVLGALVCVWGPPLLGSGLLFAAMLVRVRRLEQRLLELQGAPSAQPVVPPVALPKPVAPAAPRPVAPRPVPARAPAAPAWQWPSPERVVVWLAASIGGLALILTALFALVTVIERGWLGPSARVCGGLLAGTAAWIGGSLARRRWPWAGSAVTGGGVGTLYGTLYAAAGPLDMLPTSVAGAGMVAVTAVATLRATFDRDRLVAWLALIGGLMTPWLVSTGENKPVSFFLYLALLCAGVAASAARRGWPELVAGAALGAGAMHLAWAFQWRAPSEVPAALLGAALLSLPFAVSAGLARPVVIRVVSALSAAAITLVALPWVVPVQAEFYDPRSGLSLFRTSALALPLAALAAAALPLPLILGARRPDRTLQLAIPASVAAMLLVGAFTGAWSQAEPALDSVRVAGAVGGLGLAALLAIGRPSLARGLVGLLAVAGLGLVQLATSVPAAEVSAGVCALALAGAGLARVSRHGMLLAVLLLAAGLPLLGVGTALQPGAVAGASLVLLALVVGLGVTRTWDGEPQAAWLAAAAAPAVVFLPLLGVWEAGLGDAARGLLPLLLGALALLALRVLQRRVALPPEHLALAAFVGVILLGAAVAVPLQLQQRWLTVAWALEAAALAYVSSRVRHDLVRFASFGLCLAVSVRLLCNPWALQWGDAEGLPLLNWTLYTWGVPLVCLLLCARWLPRAEQPGDLFHKLKLPLALLATLVGFALVNVEVSHAFQDHGPLTLSGANRVQSMVRSASWALYGMTILGLGLWRDHRVIRLVGFAFVLLAALKVFGLDLWDLQGFVRVGSIGCLALSLIVAAFLFERLVLRGAPRQPANP